MLKCYKVLSKRKVLYVQFITVSMSKLRNITPRPCQLVIWEQGTGIIWSSIGFKLNKEIFLSLMASFEVIPPVSRSPMQCFWSKCSPLALAMEWCAPDNIYWGRKLRGAAKTRGWCRTTAAFRPSSLHPPPTVAILLWVSRNTSSENKSYSWVLLLSS